MIKKLNCVLLIDDDLVNSFYSRIIINEAGCARHVKTKETAKAALEYLSDSIVYDLQPYPDLIFLDIEMPEIDGWQFINMYKDINSNVKKAIIIILSSDINEANNKKALEVPEISGIYAKPMTPEIINTIVFKYFPDYINYNDKKYAHLWSS